MDLGVIEGFYGPLWSWDEREALIARLAPHGYRFYHYAPKGDPAVRERWRTPWPDETAERLRAFAASCRAAGLRFGAGIAPLELSSRAGGPAWRALEERLAQLDAVGIDELVLLFDDVRGDTPDLAGEQARIADFAAARTAAARMLVCPTYYSDDPLLDRLYGERPADYLETLGRRLDEAIGVFWTGEEICAREITTGHIERVTEALRRPPVLWDNYPVNDSPRMARHLHLRAFTGRAPGLDAALAGHAINPALQPALSAIPALTLPARYREGEGYEYMRAFRAAAREVLGEALARMVEADLTLLEDAGLDRLGEEHARLRARYAAIDHPAAREIVRWLDGGYQPGAGAPCAG
ncbi:MAG: hyaluronidase [Gammaproteobacteria bacterium]|nr:hyaluronidase [Gammaproteobacteria bacterium]